MTEEVKKAPQQSEIVAGTAETPVTSGKEHEYTETEQRALDQGWQDEDSWVEAGHNREDHRSAREYLDRGDLLTKIKSQSDELRKIKDVAQGLAVHNQKVYMAGYQKAIAELRQAKAVAISEGRAQQVVQIEEKIDAVKDEMALAAYQINQQNATPQKVQETQAFTDFKDKNPWYTNDKTLRNFVHGFAIDYAGSHPNAGEEEVYREMSKAARKEFPAKFNRAAPQTPDGQGTRSSGSGATKSNTGSFEKLMARLPEDQARVARETVKRGLVSKEKYVQDYEALEGIN